MDVMPSPGQKHKDSPAGPLTLGRIWSAEALQDTRQGWQLVPKSGVRDVGVGGQKFCRRKKAQAPRGGLRGTEGGTAQGWGQGASS